MRILVVSQYFWPETFRINEIVLDLAGRGHDVTVLTGPPNYPAGEVFPDYVRAPHTFAGYGGAKIIRIPVVPRGNTKLRLLANYLSFVVSGLTAGAWRLAGRPFDAILVFQASPVTSALPALLQRRLKRAPLAMWIVDLWPETLSAVGMVRSERGLGLVGRLVTFIYRRCDLILVQSMAFFASVERHVDGRDRAAAPALPPASADIRYFPAWAEQTFEVDFNDVALAPELAPYQDTFNVMFAGNIGEGQDFPTIIAAADALRHRADIRWLIVGDGRAAAGVRADVAARNLQDRVIMLGRHEIGRMPEFFKGASALLVSLKAEPVFAMTIPGKVQSYMRSGKPVIAMLDGEGAAVIAKSGGGVTAAPGDSASLARAVSDLASRTPEALAATGAAGQRYCLQEFDRATLLTRLDRWLQELAAAKPGQNRSRPANGAGPARRGRAGLSDRAAGS
jgi:colanic acid biosynthesis glycosyl transferase WcaI